MNAIDAPQHLRPDPLEGPALVGEPAPGSPPVMPGAELEVVVRAALGALVHSDSELFVRDLSERCLAARWMLHLQPLLPDWFVDVEFNREGAEQHPKQLGLETECANRVNADGFAYVVPDLIVHRRGAMGPNLLVVELKKTSNRMPRNCDHRRIAAFRERFGYLFGAFIELETRANHPPAATLVRWYG